MPTKAEKDEKFITLARKRFKLAATAEGPNRTSALNDLRMLAGEDHWPTEIKDQRQKEFRPCLTVNRLPSFMRQVTGDMRQNKSRIKVVPVDNDADMDLADIRGSIIKYIEYISKADTIRDTAGTQAASSGIGYSRIITDYVDEESFEQDIFIKRIPNQFTVYGDPDYSEADGSDRKWYFITTILEREEFEARFPKKQMSNIEDSAEGEAEEGWFYEDKVRIAEYWYVEETERTLVKLTDGSRGYLDEIEPKPDENMIARKRKVKRKKVYQCIISGAEMLSEKPTEWPGTIIPIVPYFGDEINIEGKTIYKSVIRDSKDSQKLYNFWRTSSAELIALAPKAPFIGTVKQFEGQPEWDDANVKSYSKLQYNSDPDAPGSPKRQEFAGVPTGIINEAQMCIDDMKGTTGIYDASLGARSNETSGKAIRARQTEGDVSTFVWIDNMARAIALEGRIINELIPYIYDTDRIIRITNEDGSKESIPINQPVVEEKNNAGRKTYRVPEEDEQPTRNLDVTTGKYDIQIETGPSYTTQRQESAEALSGLMRDFGAEGLIIAPEVVRSYDFPNADDISKVLKDYLIKKGVREPDKEEMEEQGEQGPPVNPAEEQAAQAQQAEMEKAQMDMQLKAQELEIKRFEAETKRMEAETKRLEVESKMSGMYRPETGTGRGPYQPTEVTGGV